MHENRDACATRYSSGKKLLLEYTEADSGQLWSVKGSAQLSVWLGWIVECPNLNSAKREDVCIPGPRGRFVITGMDCLLQGAHKNFEVVVPVRNPGFFPIETGREDSSLCAYQGSYLFVYYAAVMKTRLARIQFMQEAVIQPLSVFVSHE